MTEERKCDCRVCKMVDALKGLGITQDDVPVLIARILNMTGLDTNADLEAMRVVTEEMRPMMRRAYAHERPAETPLPEGIPDDLPDEVKDLVRRMVDAGMEIRGMVKLDENGNPASRDFIKDGKPH